MKPANNKRNAFTSRIKLISPKNRIPAPAGNTAFTTATGKISTVGPLGSFGPIRRGAPVPLWQREVPLFLCEESVREYGPDETYHQPYTDIHRVVPEDGTVTAVSWQRGRLSHVIHWYHRGAVDDTPVPIPLATARAVGAEVVAGWGVQP